MNIEVKEYVDRKFNQTTRELIELAEANRDLATKTSTWSANITNATVTFTFVYEYVNMTLTFEDGGTVLNFEGSAPGVGLGGSGGGYGYAVFNCSPQQLLAFGKVSMRAITESAFGGAIGISWFEHKTIGTGPFLGSGAAVSLGVGGGIPLGGSGTFTQG